MPTPSAFARASWPWTTCRAVVAAGRPTASTAATPTSGTAPDRALTSRMAVARRVRRWSGGGHLEGEGRLLWRLSAEVHELAVLDDAGQMLATAQHANVGQGILPQDDDVRQPAGWRTSSSCGRIPWPTFACCAVASIWPASSRTASS